MATLPTTKKPFRFGVASAEGPCGLTFKVRANKKGDVYLSCREIRGEKLSLHQSGVDRWAADGDGRPALNRATLLELIPGKFATVVRVLFTSYTGAWSLRGEKAPKDFLAIEPPEDGSVAISALSFTPHHPLLYQSTATSVNRAVLDIAEDRFLTLSTQNVTTDALIDAIPQFLCPHPAAEFVERTVPVGDGQTSDVVTMFNSNLNTFVFWCHQNIPNAQLGTWRKENHVDRGLVSAHASATKGDIPVGSPEFEAAWNAHQRNLGKPSLKEQLESGMITTARRQWWLRPN